MVCMEAGVPSRVVAGGGRGHNAPSIILSEDRTDIKHIISADPLTTLGTDQIP